MERALTHAVAAATQWVFRRLDHFTPFGPDDRYDPSRLKAFVEFSIMLATYRGLTDLPLSETESAAIRLLQEACARTEFIDRVMRSPEILVEYAEICGVLRELRLDNVALRDRVQSAVAAGITEQVERVPHRLLEVRLALDWAGVGHALPTPEELLRDTILARRPCAPWLSREAMYALTHVVMFAGRFGLQPCVLPEYVSVSRVQALLCDLTYITIQAQEWDLLGELLLCWDCLSFEPTLLIEAGWRSFLTAQCSEGSFLPKGSDDLADASIPPTAVSHESSPGMPAAEPGDAAFRRVYHPTLVAILAGTTRLHRLGRHGARA